mmetsp:Transcript_1487/g.1896  ORF Transcript_1487/g.1896 Transcript_1487/m.1896 type:complete len:106 (-) Transcript_1487:292-609(-)|eukprot:CAMPEP_0172504620 /NCGR_PEP_ID=MMETSP1066-20121228/180407_1 /TAXON_ID=671091 /ORGANISM="Coscinodiscus wailesii, Strain CCMP2513" /LENGTH=105 /DNA_ID=CAMNT_0013280893 /DNA_START=216 /DNA_END=533 /DNA_ORIENTATION=-
MTTAEQAKHLDSVTDHVQEQELDESKANQAMSALTTTKPAASSSGVGATKKKKVSVSKDDVALIVSELEVSDDVAERALREVGEEGVGDNGGSVVGEALRRLIVT